MSQNKMNKIKAGLDCDGVLSNFAQGIIIKACDMGIGECFPEDWTKIDKWMFSDKFLEVWDVIEKDENFWLSLPPFPEAQEAFRTQPFTPELYLTRRPVSSDITAEWLRKNGFPEAPVYTVDDPSDKIHILKDNHVDVFVDDLVSTVRQLVDGGINAVLYKAPYQVSEDISGLKVISSLTEIPNVV